MAEIREKREERSEIRKRDRKEIDPLVNKKIKFFFKTNPATMSCYITAV